MTYSCLGLLLPLCFSSSFLWWIDFIQSLQNVAYMSLLVCRSSHPISIHLTKTCLLAGIKGPLRFYVALGKKKKQLITLFSCHLWKYGLILVSPLILSPLWSGRWAAMYHLFGNYQAWVRFHPSGPAKLKRTPHITHFLGISTKSPLFFGACMLSRFSRVQLFVTLWTVAHQDPLSMDFSRQECWSGLPCPPPGDLPNPGIKSAFLKSPALAGRLFIPLAPPGKPFFSLEVKAKHLPTAPQLTPKNGCPPGRHWKSWKWWRVWHPWGPNAPSMICLRGLALCPGTWQLLSLTVLFKCAGSQTNLNRLNCILTPCLCLYITKLHLTLEVHLE